MSERTAGLVRTAATLGVLALLLVFGVTRGLDAVSEPFPENEPAPVCVDSAVSAGDLLRTAGVTVSVINAGTTTGLARSTLDDLGKQGFDEGEVDNRREPEVGSAQIWSPDGRTPAVRLVRSYLGGQVRIVERSASTDGVTVVVGDDFPGVRKGRFQVKVTEDGTVCGPPALG